MHKLGSWQQRQHEIARDASNYTRLNQLYQRQTGSYPMESGKEQDARACGDLANFDRNLVIAMARYDALERATQDLEIEQRGKRLPPLPKFTKVYQSAEDEERDRAKTELSHDAQERGGTKGRTDESRRTHDLRHNFLWATWALQFMAEGDAMPEFQVWSESLAARALLRLAAMFPQFYRTWMLSLYGARQHELPDPRLLERFYFEYDLLPSMLDSRAIELFLSRLYRMVPGSKRAITLLLSKYNAEVRQVLNSSTLGDHLPEDSLYDAPRPVTTNDILVALGSPEIEQLAQPVTRHEKMANAVELYKKGYTGAQIEELTRVNKQAIFREVKRLGISRPRGQRKKEMTSGTNT